MQLSIEQMHLCIECSQVLLESMQDRPYATQVLFELMLQIGHFFDRFLGLGRLEFQVWCRFFSFSRKSVRASRAWVDRVMMRMR